MSTYTNYPILLDGNAFQIFEGYDINEENYNEFWRNADYKITITEKQMEQLNTIINFLPEKDQQLFNLIYVDKLKNNEISKKIDKSPSTVTTMIQRLNDKIKILKDLPLELIDLLFKSLKTKISKRDIMIFKTYLKSYNNITVSKQLDISEITVRRTLKRLYDHSYKMENPKFKTLLIGLLKNKDKLTSRNQDNFEITNVLDIIEITKKGRPKKTKE